MLPKQPLNEVRLLIIARTIMGYDQNELGDLIGVTGSYVSRMEKGNRKLTVAAKTFTYQTLKWFTEMTSQT
jgi:transcriptional regulator with XRE-family HTH domain